MIGYIVLGGLVILIIARLGMMVRGRRRPPTTATTTPGGTATPTPKTRTARWPLVRRWGWIALVAILGISLLSHPAREMFWMGALPRAVQTHVAGRVILPFTLTTLTPGQKVAGCLPQGTWTFVGVEGISPRYDFKKKGEKGLRGGFWEKGGDVQGLASQLPLPESDRYGSLLISTDTVTEYMVGTDVVVSGACGAITVTPNVEGGGKGFSLPHNKTVSLIFAPR